MVRAIEAFPNDAVTLNNTAWLCALCGRNMDKAKEFADRAVAIRHDPTYLDTLAEVEFRRGRAREALELSQQCREMEPRDDQHKKQIRRFSKALTPEHE
jgi:tetratricopeptide (TPR) repeat protein